MKRWGHRTCLRVSRFLNCVFLLVARWKFESPSYRIKSLLLETHKSLSWTYPFLIAWLWGYCTFSDSFVVGLKSSPWHKYTKYETVFQKNHVLLSIFFSCLDMFFIRLFFANANTECKKKSGVTVLVSSQKAVKGGHGFEIAVRMNNLRCGDCGEIQNSAHRVRSMHSRLSLFSVVFIRLILPTQTFILNKSTINTKEWGKSKFDEILELWIFILEYFVSPVFCLIPVSSGSIFCFCAIMLDKET